MTMVQDTRLAAWAQGPSVTEEQRVENAQRMVREAIQQSPALQARNIAVFVQGSHRNRVNVVQGSDVDLGVLCYDTYFPHYPDDNVKALAERTALPATYTYSVFKDEIEQALVAKFGRFSVSRGRKAFDVTGNTYRVEADVAAFFEHRRYTSATRYHSGVEMIPDDYQPPRIRNWPEQHYGNGVAKNQRTYRRYKRVVRMLKKLRLEMSENGIQSATNTPGFLIECLVFNAPDTTFGSSENRELLKSALAWLYSNTQRDEECNEWGEVSELKYIFRGSQPWTRASANQFLLDAWAYFGF